MEKKIRKKLEADAERAMDPRARLHRPHRLSRRDKNNMANLLRSARSLKTHNSFWGKPLSSTVGGMDLSRVAPIVNAMNLPNDAHKALDHVRHEFTRNIYDPQNRYTVLRGSKHVRHRDYSHRIEMPSLQTADDYKKIAMKTQPIKEDLEKKKKHFFRVGLMADFISDVKLSRNIQVRLFKNLIEVIVDGRKVLEKELYVLAHFISKRPGQLYAVRGRKLDVIFEIKKGTSDTNVARYIIRE